MLDVIDWKHGDVVERRQIFERAWCHFCTENKAVPWMEDRRRLLEKILIAAVAFDGGTLIEGAMAPFAQLEHIARL